MSSDQHKLPRPLDILFISDSPDQADHLIQQLLQSGYELNRDYLSPEEVSEEALNKIYPDLIFWRFEEQTHHNSENMQSVAMARDTAPVIYFAESASKNSIADAIKSGITDFLVEDNNAQLVSIIEREFHRNKFIRQCSSNLERYKEIIDTSSDAIIALDGSWNINFFSRGAESLLGYSQEEAIGRSYASLIYSSKPKEQSLNHTPRDTNEFNLAKRRDITIRCKDGSILDCEMNMSRTKVTGDQRTYTVILRDISDRKAKEEELIRLANYDALTDIFNRYSFYKALHHEIKEAERDQVKFALLYIDLDDFKKTNDSMGHMAGDQLIREFAQRLKQRLREIDTVARMGGDEFTAILHNINTSDYATTVANKVIDLTREPFIINDKEVLTGTSIGISMYPDDATDAEKLISFADSALYRAKTNGRNQSVLYQELKNTDE